jgi:putative heme iron utilization protein
MPSMAKVESAVERGARQLLERRKYGVLITNAERFPGYPFGSLTPYALDAQGQPVLLLSYLAIHTSNLQADPKATLFVFGESAEQSPSETPRLNLVGEMREIAEGDRTAIRALYLARHPEAEQWADFGDFAFYRLEPKQMYFVGGFGVMGWVEKW